MKHKLKKYITRHNSGILLLCLVLALGTTACGQNQTRSQLDRFEAAQPISVKYEVQRGDSLARIAERLTGKAENWVEIASVNGIAVPESMQVGMVLVIPDHLVPEIAQLNTEIFIPGERAQPTQISKEQVEELTDKPETESVIVAVGSESQKKASRKSKPGKDWIFQASSLPGKLEVPVVLHRANANRTFEIERTGPEESTNLAATDDAESNEAPQLVRVVGTYYPKGIYSQPSYTSTLLMRVTPGTQLELEQSFGDWLQIRTEKGSGYIRSIDAEIIGATADGTMALSTNV